VILLDNSKEMAADGRFSLARQEVSRTLQSLSPGKTFYILLFNSSGYDGMPSAGDRPLPATPENLHTVGNWLDSVGAGDQAGADPTKAMRRAIGLAPATDTVLIMSGGAFPDSAVAGVREANAALKARINTVGIYARDGEAGMRKLASENRGDYRFVPPPGAPAQ
jgi:hypothetical protein